MHRQVPAVYMDGDTELHSGVERRSVRESSEKTRLGLGPIAGVVTPAGRGFSAVQGQQVTNVQTSPATTRSLNPTAGQPARRPSEDSGEQTREKDHFVVRDGQVFAGIHLIADMWGASNLGDLGVIERAMRDAVEVANATLLHIHLHHFGPECGVSGVAVLAESHISVHTWPERDFAAFDVFMCGAADPYKAIDALRCALQPKSVDVHEARRGIVSGQ
jgi:S-adenosylmethionine decarboxylase